MKQTKEEMLKYIDENVENEDVKISLMENITDSFDNEDMAEKLKAKEEEILELKKKYKERFLDKLDDKQKEVVENKEEIEEKKIIDIRDI